MLTGFRQYASSCQAKKQRRITKGLQTERVPAQTERVPAQCVPAQCVPALCTSVYRAVDAQHVPLRKKHKQ